MQHGTPYAVSVRAPRAADQAHWLQIEATCFVTLPRRGGDADAATPESSVHTFGINQTEIRRSRSTRPPNFQFEKVFHYFWTHALLMLSTALLTCAVAALRNALLTFLIVRSCRVLRAPCAYRYACACWSECAGFALAPRAISAKFPLVSVVCCVFVAPRAEV